MRKLLPTFTVLGLLVIFGPALPKANADVITYTESDTATGTIGTTSFSNAPITVTLIADTTNRTCPLLFTGGLCEFAIPGTATVTIGGVGTFAFTDAMEVDDFQSIPLARIADDASNPLGVDVLGTFNSAFATYDLTTAIGPLTGTAGGATTGTFSTTGGALKFSGGIGGTSTFTATINAPEPSSLLLLSTGLLGLAGMTWRKKLFV